MAALTASLVASLGAHPTAAMLIIALVAFGEAMLFVGLFVPSSLVMIGAGTLVGLGRLPLLTVLLAGAAGAVAGDALSFWIGRTGGERLRQVWLLAAHPALLGRGEAFFARHGGKSVFAARFVPAVKAVLPTVAGMAGMPVLRFTAVNVASAVVWSAAHVLPGALLGRGLGVAAVSNPRVLALAGIAAVLLGVAWLGTRLLVRFGVPFATAARRRLAAKLAQSRHPRLAAFGRTLRGRAFSAGPALLALAAVGALGLLAVLVAALVLDPGLARADLAISGALGALRVPGARDAMLAITMLADWRSPLPLAVLMLALLAWRRRWADALGFGAAVGLALAFVPLAKSLLHRPRPTALYTGAEAWSFPSGHATHAAVILGLLALLVARGRPARTRARIYAAGAAVVLLVALSRLALLAHWPSDVAAGLLFGLAVVLTVAALRNDALPALAPREAVALVLVFALLIAPLHVATGWRAAQAFYDTTPPVATVDRGDWLRDGWAALPAERLLLDGDPGEAIAAQTDLPAGAVAQAFAVAGWSPAPPGWLPAVADAVLPTRATVGALAPWPLTHAGRRPVATFLSPPSADGRSRTVARLWPTQTVVAGGAGMPLPLVLLSVTRESLDPLLGRWSQLESAPAGPATLHAVTAILGTAANVGPSVRPAGGPVLVTAAV